MDLTYKPAYVYVCMCVRGIFFGWLHRVTIYNIFLVHDIVTHNGHDVYLTARGDGLLRQHGTAHVSDLPPATAGSPPRRRSSLARARRRPLFVHRLVRSRGGISTGRYIMWARHTQTNRLPPHNTAVVVVYDIYIYIEISSRNTRNIIYI